MSLLFEPNHTPRFLVTRLSHIGDCVLTIPVVCALKKRFPSCFIAWAMEGPTHKLLGNHPCIDEIVKIPRGWITKPGSWLPLRKKLRQLDIDIVLDPQSLTKSSLIGYLSKASKRIGFSAPHGRELSSIFNNQSIDTQKSHLVDRSLDMLRHEAIGIDVPQIEFRLPIDNVDSTNIKSWMAEQSISNFMAINPGATWQSKRWVNKRFGYVARYTMQAFGIPTVVTWAGDEELQMANTIVSQSNGTAVLAPPTSLGELSALYQQADCFLGCDTGPMHIASSVGTRCIVLHGPTLPCKSGPYGAEHVTIQRWHQNGRNRKRAANDAMRDITVDDVCEAVDQVFATRTQVSIAA